MTKNLKVYNQFDELILHVEHTPGENPSLTILDGTAELTAAIRLLSGYDFDRPALANGQMCRFSAGWDEEGFLDAIGGYWAATYSWKTRIVEKAPHLTTVVSTNWLTENTFGYAVVAGGLSASGRDTHLGSTHAEKVSAFGYSGHVSMVYTEGASALYHREHIGFGFAGGITAFSKNRHQEVSYTPSSILQAVSSNWYYSSGNLEALSGLDFGSYSFFGGMSSNEQIPVARLVEYDPSQKPSLQILAECLA
ncbi:MAG TPA: hypothetical protein VMJ93_12110 [Verrucomicrobiae bacterium]|nr:hypothetical protein [Verrucomicrobiae bacterium]